MRRTVQRVAEALHRALQRRRRGLAAQLGEGGFEQQQIDTSVWLVLSCSSREVGALVLLRLHHLAREVAQLGIGHARVAEVQRRPQPPISTMPQHPMAAIHSMVVVTFLVDLGVQPRQRGLDVVEVDAGADHHVPARQRMA